MSAAGGTDKMSAATPLGGNRTYAWLGGDEFTFANWAKAVRRGRTFATSGPLLMFEADGHIPGDDLVMTNAGGSVEVKVEATEFPALASCRGDFQWTRGCFAPGKSGRARCC